MKKTFLPFIFLFVFICCSAQTNPYAQTIIKHISGDWAGMLFTGWGIKIYQYNEDEEETEVDEIYYVPFVLHLNEDGTGSFALDDLEPIDITWWTEPDPFEEESDDLWSFGLCTKAKKFVYHGKKFKWDFIPKLNITVFKTCGEDHYLEGDDEGSIYIGSIRTLTPDTTAVDSALLLSGDWGTILDQGINLMDRRQYIVAYTYVYEAATHRHARQLEAIRLYTCMQGYKRIDNYKPLDTQEAVKKLADEGDKEAEEYYIRHYQNRRKLIYTPKTDE